MSDFADKLRRGQLPSEAEWESHLIEAHAREPRMSPEAFSGFKTAEGLNSYEVLARELQRVGTSGRSTSGTSISLNDVKVIDLACGDGHLIPYLLQQLGPRAQVTGIDISPEGLALAQEQIPDSRVKFELARAQALPLADHSVDFIFCHMALMLMTPLDPVIHELARVLKPGGLFSAVVNSRGSSNSTTEFFTKLQRLTALFAQTHLPRFSEVRLGAATVSDLDSLFAEGFEHPIQVHEFSLRYHVTPEGVWEYMKNMYVNAMLPEAARREYIDELMALAKDHADPEGKVLFYVPMKLICARSAKPF